jgi:VWFA-related protein
MRTFFTILLSVALAISSATPSDAQDSTKKKPKRPRFGSSLNKLKWDVKKNQASEPAVVNHESEEPIRLQSLLVTFDLLVVDSRTGTAVSGLSQADFSVTEDSQRKTISSFNLGGEQRSARSIILIIDYSASQIFHLEKSIEAARRLILQMSPEDEMAIVTDDVELLIDFTRDRKALFSGLEKIQKRGKKRDFGESRQFSSLFAALRELVPSVESRPIIIFQTDCDEAGALRDQPTAAEMEFRLRRRDLPEFGLSDVLKAAESSRATIYSVLTTEKLTDTDEVSVARKRAFLHRQSNRTGSPEPAPQYSDYLVRLFVEMHRRGQLAGQQVAKVTGGWTYWLERADQADQIYKAILSDVNQRYVIGYYPSAGKRDGRLRKVKIELPKYPHYEVHSRTTYRAPGPN